MPARPSRTRALHFAPNRALGSDKMLGRAEPEHGILLEFADNNGNNHQYLVSTVVYLVINPLFLGQKPQNNFSTPQYEMVYFRLPGV